MKRKKKRFMKVLIIIFSVITIVCITFRYGWKLFGFRGCSTSVIIELEDVGKDSVKFVTYEAGSGPIPVVIGYIAKQEGDKLYIGVKQALFLGVLPTDGSPFHGNIPVKGKINEVILKGGGQERSIWDRYADNEFKLHMKLSGKGVNDLYYRCYIGEQKIQEGNFLCMENDSKLFFSKRSIGKDADLSKFRMEFFTKKEDGTGQMVCEPIHMNVEWGEVYGITIKEKDGVYNIENRGREPLH